MPNITCGKLDVRNLPEDEIIAINEKLWIATEIDEKIYLWNSHPSVVVKFSHGCPGYPCDDDQNLNPQLAMIQERKEAAAAANGGTGPENTPCDSASCSESETQAIPPSVTTSDKDQIKEAQKAADYTSLEAIAPQFPVVKPALAVVPMKSNIFSYGPYVSTNFDTSCGGAQVEVNPELAPWVYGSVSAMNAAGSSIVENMSLGLVKAETGSFTIPGLPVSNFSKLGTQINGVGPSLTSMNFSFGSNGISTSYEFQTFTPKFGSLNRHLLDRIKSIAKNRASQIKFLRTNQINTNRIGRKIKAIEMGKILQRQRGGTLQRVLVGEIYDFERKNADDQYGQRTVVGVDSLRQSVKEMAFDYDKKAYISLDALYGPVSLNGGGGLPQYASFSIGCHKSSPQLSQPPVVKDSDPTNPSSNPFTSGLDQYNLEISQDYINPLTNSFAADEHHHSGAGAGHVVDLIGRETSVPVSGLITNFYKSTDDKRYSDDYRFLGMRGPLVLQSWGYDTNGKPIPNAADTYDDTKKGEFVSEKLKDKFLKDWLKKPATWPVAPVDLRFDRKRGVWVSPPGYKVVVAILQEKLNAYGSAKASLINKNPDSNDSFGDKLYDNDGNEIKADSSDTEAKIKVVDRLGISYAKGTKMYCYYDTFKCEYIVLEAVQQKCIRFKLIDFCENTPNQPSYGDEWTKYAGYLDKFPNNHILGVRIDCNGDPIDKNGEYINHEDLNNEDKQKDILVNLFDTCGQWGPAYAYFDSDGGVEAFNRWKDNAFTGFAIICEEQASNTCDLGENNHQCSNINFSYDSYDIIFLESYARFVECQLTQDLYVAQADAAAKYGNDIWKKNNPEGNASATITNFYGASSNGYLPEFFDDVPDDLPFRVFDPFKDAPRENNQFAKLKAGDKVLAILDENRKKYIIYNAIRRDEKVIKFALVDNKDLGTQSVRAVQVNTEGYPVDSAGNRLTANNFANNFITVLDTFAIHGTTNAVSYSNYGTTGFGPALGSNKFSEHISGIPLKGGDQNSEKDNINWKGGPFIGYALQKNKDDSLPNPFAQLQSINEIFYLESFAQIVIGKIATPKPVLDNNSYYAGVRKVLKNNPTGGFIDGRVPITRTSINVPGVGDNIFNLRVRLSLDDQTGIAITGDRYDVAERKNGDIYNSVDGCKFIAKLDTSGSRVADNNGERLYYVIIETESIATNGRSVITSQTKCDDLNKEFTNHVGGPLADRLDNIYSLYNGFMWDPEKSKTNYDRVYILNRPDWKGKALITKRDKDFIGNNINDNLHIFTRLLDYSTAAFNGDNAADKPHIFYQVESAGTIAQVLDSKAPDTYGGIFGQPNENTLNKKIDDFKLSEFYHGIDPSDAEVNLAINDQPKVITPNHWMTYDSSPLTALWDEYADNGKISNATYRVIYIREAPTIITGTAVGEFRPNDNSNIQIQTKDDKYASGPGYNKSPVTTLISQAKNPMGFGAAAGDYVTLQRIFSPIPLDNNLNYYYIVIGVGKPPE